MCNSTIFSQEERAAFDSSGWLLRRSFFSDREVGDIARWTDEIKARPEVRGEHMVYFEDSATTGERVVQRIENFCPYHPGFDGLVRRSRLSVAIDELLGAPAVLFKEKINFKLPGGAGFEPHQDQQAGWSAYAPIFVTALVCVDDSTVDNGCLWVANRPRLTELIGAPWRPLTDDECPPETYVSVETKPGDVLLFDSYAPHRSATNLTDQSRRILYLTYNEARFGDHRRQYFEEKRAAFPPDSERAPGSVYEFKV